jgi:hypothetical protein
MNLFRSEEHLHNWKRFDPAHEEGILPLPDLMKLFSGSYFRRRLDPDWFSRSHEYGRQWVMTLIEMGKIGPFWKKPKTG